MELMTFRFLQSPLLLLLLLLLLQLLLPPPPHVLLLHLPFHLAQVLNLKSLQTLSPKPQRLLMPLLSIWIWKSFGLFLKSWFTFPSFAFLHSIRFSIGSSPRPQRISNQQQNPVLADGYLLTIGANQEKFGWSEMEDNLGGKRRKDQSRKHSIERKWVKRISQSPLDLWIESRWNFEWRDELSFPFPFYVSPLILSSRVGRILSSFSLLSVS